MKDLIIKNNYWQLLVFATLIFTLKPLEFLATNIAIANFSEDLIFPIIFHGIIYLIFLAIFISCIKLKANFFIKLLTFLASAYYLQYYFLDIVDLITNLVPLVLQKIIIYLISLLFILFLSFFITFKFLSSDNKAPFFFFILILYLGQLITLSINLFNSLEPNKDKSQIASVQFEEKINLSNNISEENIYYLILDGQTSQKYFEKQSPENGDSLNEYIEYLRKNKFKFYENAFSSYNTTYLTLGSIFNMKYYDTDITYSNRDRFFPSLLYRKPYPQLLNYLDDIGYKFHYSGNAWASCKPHEIISCIHAKQDGESNKIILQIRNLLNNVGVWTLIKRSILRIFADQILPESNDGILNFTKSDQYNSLVPASKQFYFIHNLAPHPPYPDKNCIIDKTKSIVGWGSFEDYATSVLCTMRQTISMVDHILSIDPNSIIIIQGDHGPAVNYDGSVDLDKTNLTERFSILNSVRLPDRCLENNTKSIGNVETVNLVIECITSDGKLKAGSKSKSFAGFYEKSEKFGSLENVTEKLNMN